MKYIFSLILNLIVIAVLAQTQNNSGVIVLRLDDETTGIIDHFDDFELESISKGFESSLYVQGKKDAEKYYKDYSPYTGAFFSSLVFPPAGLVTSTW